MKKLALALTGLMFISNLVFANSLTDARILETRSFSQANELMPQYGNFAGEYVESEEKRTLILLNNEQKQMFGIKESDMAFANFRHNGKFYIATLPAMNVDGGNNLTSVTKLVKEATFVKKHWGAKVRPQTASMEVHAEMVLDFYDSASLELVYNQDTQEMLSTRAKLKGLVVSIEAVRSEKNRDAKFMPAGLQGSLAVAHRIYSLAERKNNYEKETEAEISKYTMDFSDTLSYRKSDGISSQDFFLYNSILASDGYGRNQTYDLFRNNCTNRLFDLLDISMGYNKSAGLEINYSEIQQSVDSWVNDGELQTVLNFLAAYLEQNQSIEVPKFVSAMIVADGVERANMALESYGPRGIGEDDDKNFLYSFPMFIEGHLKARGLIK